MMGRTMRTGYGALLAPTLARFAAEDDVVEAVRVREEAPRLRVWLPARRGMLVAVAGLLLAGLVLAPGAARRADGRGGSGLSGIRGGSGLACGLVEGGEARVG